METFVRTVLHGTHRHCLRPEPLVRRKLQSRQGRQRPIQRFQLAVRRQRNRHWSGRPLRQQHHVGIAWVGGTVIPTFRDQILRTNRQHHNLSRVVVDHIHGQARRRQAIIRATVIRASALDDRVLNDE